MIGDDDTADWLEAIVISSVGLSGFIIGAFAVITPTNFDDPIKYLILSFLMMIYGRMK